MSDTISFPYEEKNGFYNLYSIVFSSILGKVRDGRISSKLFKKVFLHSFVYTYRAETYQRIEKILMTNCEIAACSRLPWCPKTSFVAVELGDPLETKEDSLESITSSLDLPKRIMLCEEDEERTVAIPKRAEIFPDFNSILYLAENRDTSRKEAIEANKKRSECVWCGNPVITKQSYLFVINCCECTGVSNENH